MTNTNKQREAAKRVGAQIVAATKHSNLAVIHAAESIAVFVKEHANSHDIHLDAGAEDVLPGMHRALGTFLEGRREIIASRRAAFTLARELKIIGFGEMCPCSEGSQESEPHAERTLKVVALVG